MSDKNDLNGRFKKIFLSVAKETSDKKLLNDWSMDSHGDTLPVWFAQHASDDEKLETLLVLESGALLEKLHGGDEKPKCEHGVVQINKEEEPNGLKPMMNMDKAPTTVGVNALSDEQLKAELHKRGYKQELVPEGKFYLVYCVKRVFVNNSLETPLKDYIKHQSPLGWELDEWSLDEAQGNDA